MYELHASVLDEPAGDVDVNGRAQVESTTVGNRRHMPRAVPR